MADAETTRYALVKPEVGASADSWGGKWNQNADDTDVLLSAITTAGSANAYTLTTGLSLAAYVSGQSFLIKASFTNSGAATLNVDGLGAKSLVKGASTALASGDITSGAIYRVAYNGTNFCVLNAGAGSYQPLDATLTALAALSWSSGSPVLQFTAADTVSLTLTPSVTTVTTASTTSTTHGVTAKNVADAATVVALRIEGDRATPANNDSVAASFYLSDSAGNQDEFAQIRVNASDVTSTSEDGEMYFRLIVAGSLTTKLALTGTAFASSTNDATALGTASLGWSDLHLATGGVINWNNGDVTLTHSSNALAFAGASSGYSFDATVTASQGAAATTASGTFVNTNDNASVRVLRLEGDRATPANNDELYVSFFLSDSAGNQDEFARLIARGSVVTGGAETGSFRWQLMTSGTLSTRLILLPTALQPNADDTVSLGVSGTGFADLFLSNGGVINFNAGDVTVTHSSNALEVAGGGFAAPLLASSETSGTLTVASRNRIVNCAGGVTLDDSVFAAQDWQVFDAGAANRTFTRASGLTMYVNGTDSATATLPANTMGGAQWRSASVVILTGAFY